MSGLAPVLPLAIVVRAGQHPARQGEPSNGILVVETGALLASCVTPDGHRLGELLGPGDAVGATEGTPSPVTVRALRTCRLRSTLPHERSMLLGARAARALALAHELAWLEVIERVERRLRDAADRFGVPAPGDGIALGIRLSQEDLADMAGCTRESVSRALRSLAAEGRVWIAGRGRYVLPRVDPVIGRTADARV